MLITDLNNDRTLVDASYRTLPFVAFSSDSRHLYVGRSDGVVEQRVAPDWQITKTLRFPILSDEGGELLLGVGSDDNTLLLGRAFRSAFIMKTDHEEITNIQPFRGYSERNPYWVFERRNTSVISVARDSPIGFTQRETGEGAVWDLAQQRKLMAFRDPGSAHSAFVDPTGTSLTTISDTGVVSLRDIGSNTLTQRVELDSRVTASAFSTDGRLIALALDDLRLIVLRGETGEQIAQTQTAEKVTALAFDPVDASLLLGTRDGSLVRLNPLDGARLHERGFDTAIASIEPGGQDHTLAITLNGDDARQQWHEVMFVDTDTGRERAYIAVNGRLRSHALSPRGDRFASYDKGRQVIEIRATSDGAVIATIPSPSIKSLTFSATNQSLVVHEFSGRVRVYGPRPEAEPTELGEPGGVDDVRSKMAGDRFITQGSDGSIREWDVLTGQERWRRLIDRRFDQTSLSGSGQKIVARLRDSRQKLIVDSRTGDRLMVLSDEASSAYDTVLSSDESRLLTWNRERSANVRGSNEYGLQFWNIEDGGTRGQATIVAANMQSMPAGPRGFLVSSDSYGASGFSSVELIDADSGNTTWQLRRDFAPGMPVRWIKPHLIDGLPQRLILDTGQGELQLRELDTGTIVWQRAVGSDSPEAVRLIPESDRLALLYQWFDSQTDADEIRVDLINANTGRDIRRFTVGKAFAADAVVTEDGQYLVIPDRSDAWRGLKVWRIANGSLVRSIEIDAAPRELIKTSEPDLLAVHDDADKLRVIRLSDGQTLHYLAHARSADELIVARDTERALTVSGSKLRLWDLDSGQEIGQLRAEGEVRSATLNPTGTRVAFIAERPRETGSGDTFHVAQIWTPEQESAIASFPVVDVEELKIDRSGRLLLLLSHKGSALRVMDLNTLRTLGTVAPLRNGAIQSADSLNDGEQLVVTDRGTYMMDNTSARRSALRIVTNDGQLELARIDSDWGRYVATDEANRLDYRGSDLVWHSMRTNQTGSDRTLPGEIKLWRNFEFPITANTGRQPVWSSQPDRHGPRIVDVAATRGQEARKRRLRDG